MTELGKKTKAERDVVTSTSKTDNPEVKHELKGGAGWYRIILHTKGYNSSFISPYTYNQGHKWFKE